MKKIALIVLAMLIAGCGPTSRVNGTDTPIAPIVTSTPIPSPTPAPSQTPLPLPPSPTLDPVEGVASTQVNVRPGPNTSGEVLGILPPDSRVQIIGKDPGENWWQIQYPPGKDGKAWVAAEFIRLAEEGVIPIIEGGGPTAIVQQPVNVRSGPGTSFNSLGMLNPLDVVTLTGRDAIGAWFQIEFEFGPDGIGWVNAAFVQANDFGNLPIVSGDNLIVGTGTPTAVPPQAAPTVIPARADGDSAVAPAVNIQLSASGTRSFQYSSDVSSPAGDAEDWIQFTTYTPFLKIELECEGSESYVAELLQNNSGAQNLVCGRIILIKVDPLAVYAVHFQSAPAGGLQYTRFKLRVEAIQ